MRHTCKHPGTDSANVQRVLVVSLGDRSIGRHAAAASAFGRKWLTRPSSAKDTVGRWRERGLPHLQAPWPRCSARFNGADRVPMGARHPPTCSSSLCLTFQVADALCKEQRHRLSKGQSLEGKGCATRASAVAPMQRRSHRCWPSPWGSRASADMQQQTLPFGAGG